MSGSTIGTTIGTPGLGWAAVRGNPLALGSDLLSYPEVLSFQIIYNAVRLSSMALPADQRIPGNAIDTDGVYAGETQTALERYINFLVRQGHAGCGSDSSAQARTNGPQGVSSCLGATGLSNPTITKLQQAWREWKAIPSPSRDRPPPATDDPYASARDACTSSGGTWNPTTNVCIPAGVPDEGMGTGTWILLLLLGAAAAYGVWYVATE
jgi:hypothetical protein